MNPHFDPGSSDEQLLQLISVCEEAAVRAHAELERRQKSQERRVGARLSVQTSGRLSFPLDDLEVRVVDIGQYGAQVVTRADLEVGLATEREGERIDLPGRVVWAHQADGGALRLGISFLR